MKNFSAIFSVFTPWLIASLLVPECSIGQVTPPKAPQAPTVIQTTPPQLTTTAKNLTLPMAPPIANLFNEEAYKKLSESGVPLLLIFSEQGSPIWEKQGPVIKEILKTPEFGRIATLQIDLGTQAEAAKKFFVTSGGTLLLMKSGEERVRSTRMVTPEAIKKMLRLYQIL